MANEQTKEHRMPPVVDHIIRLYRTRGSAREGVRHITQEQHALQCAQLAEEAGADAALTAAALLHDLGHLLEPVNAQQSPCDLRHEMRGLPLLGGFFPPAVLAPIRLHVPAKRYLCAVDPGYWDRLSPWSKRNLALQGGPMRQHETGRFLAQPHAASAVALRRWDDQARSPDRRTPGWEHYRRVLQAAALREPEALAA
jgi:phosphonate degradation associated HDIG domain protein